MDVNLIKDTNKKKFTDSLWEGKQPKIYYSNKKRGQ